MNGIWDQELLRSLNSFGGSESRYLWELVNNELVRGFPLFFALIALWFSGDCRERRSRMLTGLLAVCVATVLSVWLQFHLASHTRPLLDPALQLKIIDDHRWRVVWDRTGSFPSDTSTLFFALATVTLLENRWAGLFCFLWTTMVVALPRVIFAWHYPSDIIGSLVLGPTCVFLFSAIPYPRKFFERVLTWFEGRMYIVHALLFIFLIDAANLFQSLEQAGKGLVRMWE
ncbi:PA-phosphatase [Bradyrhizobium zhanjiangense]|uniref:PA-phosphatase n=2 Tax=Bradyrhizobium zhanjiangense TaxID=1325107 RepID=A0A4Q0SSQ8_9BRAD|nr:PA-phosphatase [Bradyrhizobium zhanjiangense]